jgi:hypothetical protein
VASRLHRLRVTLGFVAPLAVCPGSTRPWRAEIVDKLRACVGPVGAKVRRVSGPIADHRTTTALSREHAELTT